MINMKEYMMGWREYLSSICRRIPFRRVLAAAAGIILLSAAILKAYDIELFMRQIKDYQIITGDILLVLSAWGLIIAEFVLGVSLILYYRPGITIPLSIALFCVFIGATMWAWITGVTEDCGCFGSWVKRSPAGAMIEDLLITGALFLAWPGRDCRENKSSRIRPAIVTLSLFAGISLPIAYGGPVQDLLGIERGWGAADKDIFSVQGIEDIDPKNGSFLFVLVGTDCSHCRDSVRDFNRLAGKEGMPEIISLTSDAEDQIDSFIGDLEPEFPLRKISEDDFYRLLGTGTTPRSILVVGRHVLRTWDEEVPAAAEIAGALVK